MISEMFTILLDLNQFPQRRVIFGTQDKLKGDHIMRGDRRAVRVSLTEVAGLSSPKRQLYQPPSSTFPEGTILM